MLTSRGWWLFLLSTLVLILGVAWTGKFSALHPLLGGTLLIYFGWEWALFQYRSISITGNIVVTRKALQHGRVTPVLWARSKATIQVTIENRSDARLPFTLITDRLPHEVTLDTEAHQYETSLEARQSVTFEYDVDVGSAGLLRFEGLTIRSADFAGFFYHRHFISAPVEYLVLPFPVDHDGKRRDVKRFNALPPPGVHRLRRAGSGDELHDLRDYRPGDSPKMIAWKASARRDRLITKEFESDVPVRCLVFVDATSEAWIPGTNSTLTAHTVEIAAAILQAASANRDLVGLTIFTEDEPRTLLPARSKRHTLDMLKQLSLAAGRAPQPQASLEVLARTAYITAQEVMPERLQRDVNARPFGLFWQSIADSRLFYLFLFLMAIPVLFSRRFVLEILAELSGTFAPSGYSWAFFLGLAILPGTLAGLLWFFHGIRGFLPPQNHRTSRRKRLALVYATDDADSPAMVERYLHDDEEFMQRTAKFLRQHRVRLNGLPGAPPTEAGLLPQAANALVRSLSRAKDTEVYIFLLDLLELPLGLERFCDTIRAARARKHQVIILIPRPKELSSDETPSVLQVMPGDVKLPTLLKAALLTKLQRSDEEIRRTLTRAGATVIRFEEGSQVPIVLQKIDQVRMARFRR